MNRCTKDDLNIFTKNETYKEKLYKKKKLYNYYCPRFDTNYFLWGNWEENSIGHMQIGVRKCNPKTEKHFNITCVSNEEFTKFVQNNYIYFESHYTRSVISPKNYEKPSIPKIQFREEVASSNRRLINNYYLHNSNFESDIGWVFEELKNEKFINFHEANTNNKDFNFGILTENPFYASNIRKNYHRIYLKVPELIANVGGILSLYMPLVEFVFSFYIDNQFNEFLIRELLKFEVEGEETKEKSILDRNKENQENKENKGNFMKLNMSNNCRSEKHLSKLCS